MERQCSAHETELKFEHLDSVAFDQDVNCGQDGDFEMRITNKAG